MLLLYFSDYFFFSSIKYRLKLLLHSCIQFGLIVFNLYQNMGFLFVDFLQRFTLAIVSIYSNDAAFKIMYIKYLPNNTEFTIVSCYWLLAFDLAQVLALSRRLSPTTMHFFRHCDRNHVEPYRQMQ